MYDKENHRLLTEVALIKLANAERYIKRTSKGINAAKSQRLISSLESLVVDMKRYGINATDYNARCLADSINSVYRIRKLIERNVPVI